jgi:acyl-coenzyme A synthetase/AMP-(fatty) acid ligase
MNNLIPITLNPLLSVLFSEREGKSRFSFGPNGVKSWSDFLTDVAVFSTILSKRDEQKWAICVQDSYWFSIAFFSACLTRKTVVLPGNQQPDAIRELSSQFDALINDKHSEPSNKSVDEPLPFKKQTINIETSISDYAGSVSYALGLLDEKTEIILFTSGSSGQPKPIKKSLAQLDCEIAQLERIWGSQIGRSQVLSTVSHQHIYGLLFRLLWPICAHRPFSRENLEFPEHIMNHGDNQTLLVSSPALLKRLTNISKCTPYRLVFSSGGPLSIQAARESLRLLNCLPYEVFGSTETGGIGYRQQEQENTPWTPLPDVQARIGAEGCIELLSDHIDPSNWYQTTDQCEVYVDGTFMLKGRSDRIIKIEEKRISLAEVENRLQQLDWVSEAVVTTFDTDKRIELVSAITLTTLGKEQLSLIGKGAFWIKLRNSLRLWLEPVAIPRRYRILEDIPLNSQGKRQIKEIEALFMNDQNKDS